MVDSAALQREVGRIVGEPRGLLLAQIYYDSIGALDTVRIRSEWLSEADDEALTAFIQASVPGSLEPDSRFDVLLADRTSSGVRRLRDVASCPPRLRDLNRLSELLAEEGRGLGLRRPRRVVLHFRVEVDGSVHDVQVDESSGRADADLAAATVMRRANFTRGLIEGIPVPLWVRIPVTLTPGR